MRKTVCLLAPLCLLFTLCVIAYSQDYRPWTFEDAKIEKIDAKIINVHEDNQNAVLLKKDGDVVDIGIKTLSKSDRDYIKQWQQSFTGIRCEYQEVSKDGKYKKVFLIKEILPGSPADKVKTGWTKTTLHTFYFRPMGTNASPDNIIDGLYYADKVEPSLMILSPERDASDMVIPRCITKAEWDEIETERKDGEAIDKALRAELNRNNDKLTAQSREETEALIKAAREKRELEREERRAEIWNYNMRQRQLQMLQLMAIQAARGEAAEAASTKRCPDCEANNGYKRCSDCNGVGYNTCNVCNGTGKVGNHACSSCPNGKKRCTACNGKGLKKCYHNGN